MKLREPIGIVMPLRIAVGKHAGALASFEAYKLLSPVLRAVVDRSGVDPDALNDVIAGNVRNSVGNVTRVAALDAGLPVELPAQTIDRQCASGLEALANAASKINAGLADLILVGGLESASRCPWFIEKTPRPYHYFEPQPYPIRLSTPEVGDPPMGETAEILADEFNIERDAMDAFALESHRRAHQAHERGDFGDEIIPLDLPSRKGPKTNEIDETIRADTTLDALAKLPPVFRTNGRVTAGNSSPLTDGAAACITGSRTALREHNVTPDAWITAVTTVALDPNRMGMGPAIAIPKLLDAAGLTDADIDLYEINEAFAAQILAVNTQLNITTEKLNVNGGAIALGHPLGASGMRLVVTLVHALRRRDLTRGVVSLCIGGGQGMAALIERA